AAGVARAADLLRGEPRSVAVLLSVELCSLTLQREDLSIANLVASGLFGDGAAAVVVGGDARPNKGPAIRASESVLYSDSRGVMGWRFSEQGFELVLTAQVPDMVRAHLARDVDRFLSKHGLAREDIGRWIAHPGGPKVLDAIGEALELPPAALARSWESLAQVGNLSSASVLLILEQNLLEPPPPGTLGLLFALGPGFCSELVLLEW
ncbi:MAG TPA: 3-oxoacyl-[acyl-carrier-protein] synthase III C-terminal domain-containing protein, partial [Thermoanaerobaculia bacterium]|nr:3-oxoacyl-[acyl-carrier-protein] synthase III C-terminal domain-containing protein [Thermoanaerobaculia bacterium]